MTISQSTTPYWNDYDETKGFLNILYRPGYAVQARELNQMQTILQNQVSRVGRNLFKEGAMVIPGQISYDNSIGYVKLTAINASNQTISTFLSEFIGTTITGASSGVSAKVIAYSLATDTDPATLYVKYTSNGSTTTVKTFSDNETLTSNASTPRSALTYLSASTGEASIASILSGIYFTKGQFVLVEDQTIVLSKYNNTPSLSIGLSVTESIVTPSDDPSLYDNANGSYNYAAPGAHRYKLTLTLTTRELNVVGNSDSYIELMRVNNGTLQTVVTTTDYSVIEKTLARRTYDESGDYVVKNFNIQVKENYNNNRGTWTASTPYLLNDIVKSSGYFYQATTAGIGGTIAPNVSSGSFTDNTVIWEQVDNPSYNLGYLSYSDNGDTTKLSVLLDPGKAYVRGYEIEKISTTALEVDKARTYDGQVETQISPIVGNYIIINNVYEIPETITSYPTINLYNAYISSNGNASGTLVGTARVRGIDYNDSTSSKLFIFDVNMSNRYSLVNDVKSVFYDNSTINNFTANVKKELTGLTGAITAAGTTITGTGTRFLTELAVGDYITDGTTTVNVATITNNISLTVSSSITTTASSLWIIKSALYESDNSALIYPIGYSNIRKLRELTDDSTINASYTAYQDFGLHTSNGSGSFTISLSATGQTFSNTAGYGNYIIVNTSNGSIVTPNISLNGLETTATFSGLSNNTIYKVVAAINMTSASAKEKTKTLVTGATIDFTSLSTVSASKLFLGKADCFKINSIKMASAFGTYSATNEIDVTANYAFSTGQTQDYYGLSYITLKSGNLIPTGTIRVSFEYFTHGTGDYFSVNSYTGVIDYSDINPVLRDSLDFRPRIGDDGTFSSATASICGLPKRGYNFTSDVTYYIPRNDKIVLDSDGNMSVVKGTPSDIPQDPSEPDNTMVLYKLQVPAYTHTPSSVTITPINNKRYTMKDIGNLDQRLSNVEYYTSLSLLEQQTQSQSIPDATTGLEMYKNGFIVDSFSGHGIGDTTNQDYNCAIDTINQQLRPAYAMTSVNLIENVASDIERTAANYVMKGGRITLPYAKTSFISQPYASTTENVNPFAIFTFIGSTTLNPSVDDWFDTTYAPDIVNNDNSQYDAMLTLANKANVLGTVWNAWQTVWTGVPQVTNYDTVYGVHTTDYSTYVNGVKTGTFARSAAELNLWGGTSGQARTISSQTTSTQVGQARTGITTSIQSNVNNQIVGTSVIASSAIPYMRDRFVLFTVRGLKPNTTFYPYFDTTNISSFVTPASVASIATITGYASTFNYEQNVGNLLSESARIINGNADSSLNKGEYVTGQTSGATGIVAYQDSDKKLYLVNIIGTFTANEVLVGSITGSRVTLSSIELGVTGDPIVSNKYGDVIGLFEVPNTSSLKFRCGTRTFKLTDSTTDGLDFTSKTTASYEASGTIQTKQNTIQSTKTASFVETAVSDTQTITTTSSSVKGDTGWWDPLAETFLVNQKGGCFLTGVDVYFATKDPSLPVTVEIWETVNGYPAQKILPFSSVVKRASDVLVSNDSTIPTYFEFQSPVYVNDATEYCVAIKSDSNLYKVWISEMGGTTVDTNTLISSQPYAGVLFKSQNASTWTANQNQDLKFTLYRASFNTSVNASVPLVNQKLPLVKLNSNPLKMKAGLTTIRVYHNNHGFVNGSNVTISGLSGTVNGVASSALNGSHIVSSITKNSYLITIAGISPIATGYFGGTNLYVTSNVSVDLIQLNSVTQNFADTSITNVINIKNQDLSTTTSQNIVSGLNLEFSETHTIGSNDNPGNVNIISTLQSTNEYLSPVLDIDRLSLVCISNSLNNPSINDASSVDYQPILSGVSTLSLSAYTISTSNTTAKAIFVNLTVGRYLSLSGCTNPGNNTTVKILAVASDGSSITTDTSFTTESGGAITVSLLDFYVDEIAPVGGSSISKYITKTVTLANASTYFKLIYSGSIPQYANVGVYYRTSIIGAATDISNNEWTLVAPDSAIIANNDGSKFTDVNYSVNNLPAFDGIQVKLVMTSTNSAYAPLIKDFRLICCA